MLQGRAVRSAGRARSQRGQQLFQLGRAAWGLWCNATPMHPLTSPCTRTWRVGARANLGKMSQVGGKAHQPLNREGREEGVLCRSAQLAGRVWWVSAHELQHSRSGDKVLSDHFPRRPLWGSHQWAADALQREQAAAEQHRCCCSHQPQPDLQAAMAAGTACRAQRGESGCGRRHTCRRAAALNQPAQHRLERIQRRTQLDHLAAAPGGRVGARDVGRAP